MKILFLTHHLKGDDGWSRYAKDLAEGLKKEGADILCLVNEITSDLSIPQIAILGEPLPYISNPPISFLAAIRVRKIIRDFQPDIIHVIVEQYGTILPFLKKNQQKFVITVHSTYAFMPILVSGLRRKISIFLTKRMYKKTDLIICVSEYTKQHLIKHMSGIGEVRLVDGKMFVLAGGVNIVHSGKLLAQGPLSEGSSSNEENQPSKKLNQPKEILFVGALKPRKGLVEAINALSFVTSDFVYRIVGSYKETDPYVKLIKQKIAEFGLDKKVVFEGRIDDKKLNDLYKKADLFLMLSINNGADFEGYGLVYIEASARGVPCIGPKDSGVSDAIVDGKTGFLVDQYDSPAVAKTIDTILQNNPIKVKDCLDWAWENRTETKSRKIFEIYEKIIHEQ